MALDESIEQQLEVLYREYAQELPQRFASIEATWSDLTQGDWDIGALRKLHRMAHSLAGSGASFGFPEVSESARALEIVLKDLLKTERVPGSHELREVRERLLALVECLSEPADSGREEINTPQLVSVGTQGDGFPTILIVNCEPQSAEDLSAQVRHFGYETKVCESAADCQIHFEDTQPVALIVGATLSEEQVEEVHRLLELEAAAHVDLPILFVSPRGDLEARLQAVHAGASAYFTKPVDIGKLVDKLDELTTPRQSEPYRVLVVDDDISLASHYALVLQQAGMLAVSVSDPVQIMQQLADFGPDLILMDVYMPIYTGVEIARVVRQMDAYVGIPIVFLSTEADVDKQFDAMRFGGDEFLTKPIHPSHLVAAITTRVERSRKLRSLMTRDSLTGLLNHSHMKEHLATEVARAQRQDSVLAFAMLDIDYFKSVNDSHGHVAGDYVLKNLARLLKQRLRRTDVIGRYGGEEFAVILPDTGGLAAVQLMDELRLGFAQVRHQWNGVEFTVSFSCGIVVYPACADIVALIEAADSALYAAKQGGRNQVTLCGGDA